MDAGDVMGAVSLGIQALQLFGSCQRGYQNLLDACEMDSDLLVLRCRLEIETQRFHLWGEASDVEGGNLDVSARHAPVVLSTLKCLHTLVIGQVDKVTDYDVQGSRSTNQNTCMAGALTGAVGSLSRHARWILSDKHRLEATVNEIKAINDSLESLLGQSRRAEMAQSFQELSIRVLGTNNSQKLQILRAAAVGQYEELSTLMALKSLRIAMDEADNLVGHHPPQACALRSMTRRPLPRIDPPRGGPELTGLGTTTVCTVHRKRVIFEWFRLPVDHAAQQLSVSRIEWVAQFIAQATGVPNLRSLALSGLSFHQTEPYAALTYKFPEGLSDDCGLVSLDDIFNSTHICVTRPSLNDRLALATTLARYLLSLHTCGWLHKAICPANVVFFCPEGYANQDIERFPSGFITRPYIKGYSYSRRIESDMDADQQQQNAMHSESIEINDALDFYRHPTTFESGGSRTVFKKVYDLYSFGILLLEIGLWRTSKPEAVRLEPKQVQDMLCRKYLQGQLAYRVGTTYEEVVRTCLVGEFGEDKSEKNWLEIEFLRRVVQKLESCKL